MATSALLVASLGSGAPAAWAAATSPSPSALAQTSGSSTSSPAPSASTSASTTSPTSTATVPPSGGGTGTARPTTTAPTTAPTSTSPPSVPAPPVRPVDADGPLTPQQVQVQLAQAAALAAQRRAVDAGLEAALVQLQDLGRRTSAALQELGDAKAAEAQALRTQRYNQDLLAQLAGNLTVQRDALGEWARETYTIGGPMAAYEGWLVALQARSTADVAHSLSVLESIGVAGSVAVQRLRTAVATQQQATQRAALAAAQAQAARTRADAAVTALRALQQQARVAAARLRVQQATLYGESALTAEQRANLQAAEALVAAAGPVPAGSCRGLDVTAFPNGMIPPAALCPVWGAPGHLLRADAAAAFRRLSRQYAAQFGRPICVTDSYRSLASQVKVYADKPRLAARPGTSNHGLGVAVDLCGGIESFGTVEHAWMLAHAPLTGWFHPAWAEPSGGKPEPWHWEFAG